LAAKSGHVYVRLHESDGGLAVEIEDDGPGLPPRARENLFTPFAGSARKGGTGLGLAIARDIMMAHGGDIQLVRSGKDGTLFRLSFRVVDGT
jgi:signal transduction histidine kinase